MIEGLRDYQERAIQLTYDWLDKNTGNPVIVAPTGSGKSWIIAALCEDLLKRKPEGRVLVLSHQKELLAQDAEKILLAWPTAPLGVFSAGLKRKDMDRITVAGIQSIHRRAAELGAVDVVIVDEAHLINNSKAGMYRKFIAEIQEANPAARVIGLTATPYRLGQGMITEGEDALFHALIEPVTIQELIDRGYLAPLRSKFPAAHIDLDGVHIRGGEYIESELQAAVDVDDSNRKITAEIIERAKKEGREHWIIFCTGVEHAQHMREELEKHGIKAATVTGKTPQAERDRILEDFKNGWITAVTNANVLTTGFDAPLVDLIAFCRPTLSPGLYVQMAGRGMRISPGKKDCLVLDFGGNVMRHGPIIDVTPPRKGQKGKKPAGKTCPSCGEILALGARLCPVCGHEFPAPERERAELAFDGEADIMGRGPNRMAVARWFWHVSRSRSTGIPMLVVDYQAARLDVPPLREYLCLLHGGYAEKKAISSLREFIRGSGVLKQYPHADKISHVNDEYELHSIAAILTTAKPPAEVEWVRDGKYRRILSRDWTTGNQSKALV